jgi:hypothetical protein
MIDFLKLSAERWSDYSDRMRHGKPMAFLRQQLLVLKRSAPARLRLRNADRLIFVWLYRLFPSLLGAAVIFKPETLVRGHRSGFRLYWRWKSRRRRVSRPAVPGDIRDLVRTMSRDNPLWGAPRIHGELLKLGIDIASPLSPSTCLDAVVHPRQADEPSWTITPSTSPPLICSSSQQSDSNCSTGWSSCAWSGDGSSGPMRPEIRPPSGSPDK